MRVFLLASILSVLAGCGGLRIDTSHTSLGQDSRVQFVILHYTSSDLPRSLATLSLDAGSPFYDHAAPRRVGACA